MAITIGGDLRGTGDGASKFEVGDCPCIRPTDIWRSRVTRCAGKYQVLKNVT